MARKFSVLPSYFSTAMAGAFWRSGVKGVLGAGSTRTGAKTPPAEWFACAHAQWARSAPAKTKTKQQKRAGQDQTTEAHGGVALAFLRPPAAAPNRRFAHFPPVRTRVTWEAESKVILSNVFIYI